MNNIKKDKVQLNCYCSDGITFEKHNDKVSLASSLKFVPYNLIFTNEEANNIINMLLFGSKQLKITIEKVDE